MCTHLGALTTKQDWSSPTPVEQQAFLHRSPCLSASLSQAPRIFQSLGASCDEQKGSNKTVHTKGI